MGEANPSKSPIEHVIDIALGYILSRSLHVATELGIADLLQDGAPKTIEELSSSTGAHPKSLYRLLRTLAAQGIFAEDNHGRFVLTPTAMLLQQGAMRDGVLLCGNVTGDKSSWDATGKLRKSVMSGEPAFNMEHGMGFFDYLGSHPECGQWFNCGMANFSTVENPAIAGAYDYSTFSHIMDIGGGQGGLLAEILKIHPKVSATLFDLPQLVQNPIYLTNSGLDKRRCATISGDFFQSVPKGGDAYILKRILHDWSDDKCVSILRCCRQAIGDDKWSCMLVVDGDYFNCVWF